MNTTTTKPAPMRPLGPKGWFRAAHVARDTEAVYQSLVRDNGSRAVRGLPEFEPSYGLARAVAENMHRKI